MDRLQLYKGRDLEALEMLHIKHPTVDDIEKLGYDNYSIYVNLLSMTPVDIADILWCEMKVWYKDVTQWLLFLQLFQTDEMVQRAIRWWTGSDFVLFDDGTDLLLYDEENKVFINEHTFMFISQFLRTINFVTPPKLNADVVKAGNKLTAKYLLEKQYMRRNRASSKWEVQVDFPSIVSSLQWVGGKGNEIWEYPVYRIYEGYMRLNLSDNYDKTMTAYYSGNLDTKKSQIDFDKLNWSQIIKL